MPLKKIGQCLVICFLAFGFGCLTSSCGSQTSPSKPTSGSQTSPSKPINSKQTTTPPKLSWGIDTVSPITSSFYQCVASNYGNPLFVARYLTTKSGVYSGINSREVKRLHNKGVKILPIYDHFHSAKGLSQGKAVAKQALKRARQLGVPKGTILVADIELSKPVDSGFIIGWTQTLLNNSYKPGIYGNFVNGQVKKAYTQAANKNKGVQTNLLIWTNQPSIGVTGDANAPHKFNASSPHPKQTIIWQYGVNGSSCNIDSDLMKGKFLNNLW